jgi:protein SCO1/2
MNEKRIRLRNSLIAMVTLALLGFGCDDSKPVGAEVQHEEMLPYYGEPDVLLGTDDKGVTFADTLNYSIPKFSFINQDSAEVSHNTYTGKIFVADFFFTTCPSICPMLSAQMVRVQQELKNRGWNDRVWLLSHTVDPQRDTPEVLKAYGDQLGADYSNWNFVTGKADDIYYQAEDGYMLTAFPSDTAQGGFFHTDKFSLIDANMHIRGYYDGTSTQEVDRLLQDIEKLLKEEKDQSK